MNLNKTKCYSCSKVFKNFFDYSRCALCSKAYLDYKFCNLCCMRVNYKFSDRIFMRKYCFPCYLVMELSKFDTEYIPENTGSNRTLPTQQLVSLI